MLGENKTSRKRDKYYMSLPMEVPRRVKFIETESMNGGFQEIGGRWIES